MGIWFCARAGGLAAGVAGGLVTCVFDASSGGAVRGIWERNSIGIESSGLVRSRLRISRVLVASFFHTGTQRTDCMRRRGDLYSSRSGGGCLISMP